LQDLKTIAKNPKAMPDLPVAVVRKIVSNIKDTKFVNKVFVNSYKKDRALNGAHFENIFITSVSSHRSNKPIDKHFAKLSSQPLKNARCPPFDATFIFFDNRMPSKMARD